MPGEREPLSAEEEAAAGWAHIDQRFLRWHHRTCGVIIFKGNRPECDCGLQATLDAARESAGSVLLDGVVLRPCHVTGMHTPDHHLTSDRVCDIQARDIAEQIVGDLAALPRALHPNCYWCGAEYQGQTTPSAGEQAAWVARLTTGEEAPKPRYVSLDNAGPGFLRRNPDYQGEDIIATGEEAPDVPRCGHGRPLRPEGCDECLSEAVARALTTGEEAPDAG